MFVQVNLFLVVKAIDLKFLKPKRKRKLSKNCMLCFCFFSLLTLKNKPEKKMTNKNEEI